MRLFQDKFTIYKKVEAVRVSRDYKDDICNGMLKFYSTYMQDEKKYAKALFIKKRDYSASKIALYAILRVMDVPKCDFRAFCVHHRDSEAKG